MPILGDILRLFQQLTFQFSTDDLFETVLIANADIKTKSAALSSRDFVQTAAISQDSSKYICATFFEVLIQ